MANLSDSHSILQTLHRFTQAQDKLDLATMASLLTPNQTIKFDMTKHFPQVGVLSGTANEICHILYEAGAGWTATQHPMFNPVVTVHDSSKATVRTMVQAYHALEIDGKVDSLIVHAIWEIEMAKIDDKWVMGDMAMERDVPIANPELFQTMRARMAEGHKREPASSLS